MMDEYVDGMSAALRKLLLRYPASMTVRELLDQLEGGNLDTECAMCHKPISHMEIRRGRRVWVHHDADRSEWCRSASFTDEDGWDETLDKKWKATPKSR